MASRGLSALERAARQQGWSLDEAQRAAAEALLTGGRGVYLHGPAGRGKTWLVDAWYRRLRRRDRRRVHFHSFLGEYHRAIFRAAYDTDAAIDAVLGDARLLVFDEFHMHDAGDAMLLTRLLTRLGRRGVRLIMTSNYAPRGLLPDPVFHPLADPAIDWIESSLDVVELDGGRDYRLAASASASASGRGRAQPGFRGAWHRAEPGPSDASPTVELHAGGHRFHAVEARGSRVRFRFEDLCEAPTSVHDVVEWAGRFDDWVLDGVPALAHASLAARQRFGDLVDVLCDRGHRLTVFAHVDREALAIGPGMPPDIDRTLSRLALLD